MEVTTADKWAKAGQLEALKASVYLELPSGLIIKARRADAAFMAGGHQPDTPEFFRDLLCYCVVSPQVSLDKGFDTIHPSEIPNTDVKFIFRWAMTGKTPESQESEVSPSLQP